VLLKILLWLDFWQQCSIDLPMHQSVCYISMWINTNFRLYGVWIT